MLQKRTNILFDQEQWDKLAALAKEQDTSIGDLTRKAIQQTYFSTQIQTRRAKAIEQTNHINTGIRKITYKEIKELINAGRK